MPQLQEVRKMAVLKRSEKTKCLFKELLCDLGWAPVYSEQSGIFQKNKVYFILFPSEITSEYRTHAVGKLKTGIELPIHNLEAKWIVAKDGFLIDSGNLPKFLNDAYDYGIAGSFGEKTKEFIAKIDNITRLSEMELLGREYKEINVGTDKEGYVLTASGRPLSETNMFVVNAKVCPGTLDYFRSGVAYNIVGYADNKFIVAPSSSDLISIDRSQDIFIGLDDFQRLGNLGGVIPVKLKSSIETGRTYEFEKITDAEAGLDDTFDDFKLSAVQQSYVAAAVAKGLNFTPLLDNSLSAEQDSLILDILINGGDCSAIIGKSPSAGLLELLRDISSAGLPITGFCDCTVSVAGLRNKYNGMSETLDLELGRNAGLGVASRLVAKRIAFEFRDYSHVLADKSLLELELMDAVQGKYGFMATQLLSSGILHQKVAMMPWIEIAQDVQSEILKFYKHPALKLGDTCWDIYLEQNKGKILNLMYRTSDNFYLVFSYFRVRVDYNSIVIANNADVVLWRAVLINEKAYYYCNNDIFGLL